MSGTLLLFPLAGEPGAFAWARARGRGRPPEQGRAGPDAPLEGGAGGRAALIAPGEDVTLFAVEPPTRSERQALAAARFAVEDDLAEPLEDVHVLLADRDKAETGRRREAVVVARDRLAAWREALAALGIEPDCIVPDYAALAPPDGVILVLDLGERVLARGRELGLAVDAALAPAVLGAALARRPGEPVRLASARPDAILPPGAREGRAVEVVPPPGEAELFAQYEEGAADGQRIDLARAWRQRSSGVGALALGPWRVAAGLAAAAALSALALLGGETFVLRAQAAEARAETERLLHGAFPDMGRIVNARAQLRERLGAAGAGGAASFLELSAMLSGAVAGVDGLQVESVRYDAGQGALEAALSYASYSDVEALEAGVAARGGRLAQGASRQQAGRMTGDVVVTRR